MQFARLLVIGVVLAVAAVVAGAQDLVVSPPDHKAAAPDVAVNAKGEIALLWVDRAPQDRAGAGDDRHVAITDVYVALSRDGGRSFSAPTKVNAQAGVVWGQSVSRPRIVGGPDGTWHVSYAANDLHPKLQKTALTTHYTRSVDGGRTFEAPRRLSTLTDQDMSGTLHGGFISAAAFGSIAAAPDGSVHVFWIDTRHMGPDDTAGALYGITSRDGGRTFGPERRLVDEGVCPCCQTTAVARGRSDILVGSRRITDGGIRRATVFALNGGTGAPGERISIGGAPWKIDACPLKPTVVAAHGQHVLAAVYNGGEPKPGVIFSSSADGGASFTPRGLAHPDAAVSDAPSLAVSDRFALLAWHAKTDGPRRVFHRRYTLDGEPVGPVQELPAAPGTAQTPVVAARPDGQFQVAWQQGEKIHTTVLPGTP